MIASVRDGEEPPRFVVLRNLVTVGVSTDVHDLSGIFVQELNMREQPALNDSRVTYPDSP
jgi:hypothetical protein